VSLRIATTITAVTAAATTKAATIVTAAMTTMIIWIPANLVSVHDADYLPAQLFVPNASNRVAKDWKKLLKAAVGFGPLGCGPLLLSRAVNQRGLRRNTCVVRPGLLHGYSVRIRSV
jgi:hypothetical protein